NAGTLSQFTVGSKITAAGASGANNQSYTVVANTGTQIKVSQLTTEGPTAATISYYPAGNTTTPNTLNGNLTFTPGADTIQVSSTTGFAVGQVFSVAGTTSNNGSYKVSSIAAGPPDTITVESVKVGATETVAATLQSESWYKGDNIAIEQRIDRERTVAIGIFASDPAFEKAFRAMGLIAQGNYGTAGGLENNMERVEQARYLIRDSMLHPAGNSAPFGTEESSDLESVRSQLGVTQNLIKTKTEKHQSYIGFLDDRIISMENVDKNEAITLLLDDQRALEAGYQALSKVREMSLMNFLN
ncbi:MAG: Phase-1, partial [Rhodospirillaceae bacterium]